MWNLNYKEYRFRILGIRIQDFGTRIQDFGCPPEILLPSTSMFVWPEGTLTDVVCRRDSEWQFKNFCNHPSDAQNCGFWRLDQCQCFPLDSFKLHWQPLIPSFQYPLKKQIFNVIAIRQWSSRMCSLSNMLLFIVLAFPSIFRLQLQSLPGMQSSSRDAKVSGSLRISPPPPTSALACTMHMREDRSELVCGFWLELEG